MNKVGLSTRWRLGPTCLDSTRVFKKTKIYKRKTKNKKYHSRTIRKWVEEPYYSVVMISNE